MQIYFDIRHQDTVASSNGSNHIVPANHWSYTHEDPTPLLGHDCADYAEMEYLIDAMIRDLENLKKKARREFDKIAKAKPQTLGLD